MAAVTATARTGDGVELLTRLWPAVGPRPPRASILLVHGIGDHSGRFEHVGEGLAAAGFDVHAYDQRGFGASGGRRGWVDDWRTVHDDLEGRLAEARAAAGGRPVALYGHSLGGLIALGYALAERPQPDLLVLSAPGLEDELSPLTKTLARALASVTPGVRIPAGIDRAKLAAEPIAGFRYADDPLVETSVTARFGGLGLVEQARVRRLVDGLDRLPAPTLVVHGGEDRLVPLSASARLERFAEVTRIVYPGLRHETHNEVASRTVADVVAWLGEQVAVLESGHN